MADIPPDEQPTEMDLHSCARCHTLVEGGARMCVHCHNYVILALRLAVKSSALTDWEPEYPDQVRQNHIFKMRSWQTAKMHEEMGAYVGLTQQLDLIMMWALVNDPLYWEAEG